MDPNSNEASGADTNDSCVPMTVPANSYTTYQPYGGAPSPAFAANQSILMPTSFHLSAGMTMNSPIYSPYANDMRNMTNMTSAQFASYYSAMARPVSLPYGDGMSVLSPIAQPFLPLGGGGGTMLPAPPTPLHTSHFTPISSPSLKQSRSYKTKQSSSPRPSLASKKPRISYQKIPRPKPEPTKVYLRQSQLPIRSLETSKQLLLVIDLNGTLLFRHSKKDPTDFIERPFTKDFLEYAFRNHKVMIWSSARPHNVSYMCSELFPDGVRGKLVAEWTRQHLDLTREQYDSKCPVYKRLERVWTDNEIQASFPKPNQKETSSEGWDQSNTVLIDDTLEKARAQPYNLIELPEFVGKDLDDHPVLAVLIDYLEILKMQKDVSSYIRNTPFNYATLKAQYSAVGQNGRQNNVVSTEDSDGSYDPATYNPTPFRDQDLRSDAANESYVPKSSNLAQERDRAACSETASNESYDPASFDPTSKAIYNNGKGKEILYQSSWTAIDKGKAADDVMRRLSEASLNESATTSKPDLITIVSDSGSDSEGGVRLPSSSFSKSTDRGYEFNYRVTS